MTTAQPNDPTTMVGDMLASASPDLLRSMLSTFIQTLMGAEADALCGAGYGERSPDRVNSRNGYRHLSGRGHQTDRAQDSGRGPRYVVQLHRI